MSHRSVVHKVLICFLRASLEPCQLFNSLSSPSHSLVVVLRYNLSAAASDLDARGVILLAANSSERTRATRKQFTASRAWAA
jgi:hypothetical protein